METPDSGRPALDLDALRQRESAAVEAWFRAHADAVHAFARRRVGAERAADVVQETFLAALRRIHAYDPARGAMLPWLLVTARNPIRSTLRHRERSGAPGGPAVVTEQDVVAVGPAESHTTGSGPGRESNTFVEFQLTPAAQVRLQKLLEARLHQEIEMTFDGVVVWRPMVMESRWPRLHVRIDPLGISLEEFDRRYVQPE